MVAENINTSPQQTLNDGGWITAFQQPGSNVQLTRIAVNDVKVAADLAATAVQPTDIAPMAFEDPANWLPRSEYDATISDRDLRIALLEAQVAQLLVLVGVGTIAVYETGVYEDVYQ